MKGLMLKDLYVLRKKGVLLLGLIGLYSLVSLSTGDSYMVSFLSVMMAITLPMTSIAYDERGHFDAYACALPVSRRAVVQARYLMALLFALGGVAFSLLMGLVISLLRGSSSPMEIGVSAGVSLIVALFYLSVLLPLLIGLGTEKARIVMIAVFLIPVVLVLMLSKMVRLDSVFSLLEVEWVLPLLCTALPLAAALLFLLSFFISLKIYQKKEF